MLSFLYVYSDHSILECYNLFSGVELSMRSFFVIWTEKETFRVLNPGEHSSNVSVNSKDYLPLKEPWVNTLKLLPRGQGFD